jgi:hypothetical protein
LDGGRTFEKNRCVTGLVCACCQIVVGFSKGNVVLAYRSVKPGNVRDIFTIVSGDNGKTWDRPRLASGDNWVLDGCPHAAPVLASTATGLYLAWMTGVSGKAEIYMVVSKDGGRTFGERLHVSAGVYGAKNPRLVVIGDRVDIALEAQLEERKEFGPAIVYREIVRGTPSKPIVVSGDARASYPELAADDRGLLIAWSRSSGGSPAFYLQRLK